MGKQTFEVEWSGATITPEELVDLIRRHVYSSRHGDDPVVVREITQQLDAKDDRYHVEVRPCFPMGTRELNEMATEGWRFLNIVRKRDTTVEHYRESFYHYFEKEA